MVKHTTIIVNHNDHLALEQDRDHQDLQQDLDHEVGALAMPYSSCSSAQSFLVVEKAMLERRFYEPITDFKIPDGAMISRTHYMIRRIRPTHLMEDMLKPKEGFLGWTVSNMSTNG